MKESIRRTQHDGCSECLLELVKGWKIERLSVEYLNSYREQAHFTLFNRNGLCWYHEGVIEKTPSVVMELSRNGVIEVDVDSHELLRVNEEDLSSTQHKQVLDLSDDGERWEGDVLNNQPCGWGVLYGSEGEKKYEGFMIGEAYVCYGTRYYSDIQKVEYEGQWCEGKRWRRGVQYDRAGNKVYDGEWMNDEQPNKRVVLSEENQFLHNHIEELTVSNNSCNGREWSVFDFSILINLRLLEVGDKCFENVKEVKLIGLNQLESVVIGEDSFSRNGKKNPNRHFYLKNCEQLRELMMGNQSFEDYLVCEIENVPSLEVIEMGELNDYSCNFCCASLELKSVFQQMK